ncbi:hypothetical protein [Streptomyces sp. NPDC053728]|uniref:hypothetical protein n=1 Tax=Streptomyces sp. NPDC053728 TaxID=3155534 RepID=UPI00344AC271
MVVEQLERRRGLRRVTVPVEALDRQVGGRLLHVHAERDRDTDTMGAEADQAAR